MAGNLGIRVPIERVANGAGCHRVADESGHLSVRENPPPGDGFDDLVDLPLKESDGPL